MGNSASGDGGKDRDLVVLVDLGVELVEVPDVVVVDVDVDELVEGAVLGDDEAGQPGELAHQVVEHLAHGRAIGLHRALPVGFGPEDGGQADFDRHRRSQSSRKVDLPGGNSTHRFSRTTHSSVMFPSTMQKLRTTGAMSRRLTRT